MGFLPGVALPAVEVKLFAATDLERRAIGRVEVAIVVGGEALHEALPGRRRQGGCQEQLAAVPQYRVAHHGGILTPDRDALAGLPVLDCTGSARSGNTELG